MSSRSVHIHAPVAVVNRLLVDIGGWRMWNRSLAFSALDGDCQQGAEGWLYLRRLAWLRWKFLIIEQQSQHVLGLDCHCMGVHIHIHHHMTELSADQTLLRIEVSGVPMWAGYWIPATVLPWWLDYQRYALKGIGYAAQEVYAADQVIQK